STFGFCPGKSKTDNFKIRVGAVCDAVMISCPEDVTLMTDDCQTSCVRPHGGIAQPIACSTADCQPVQVDCSPALNSCFPLGPSKVTCTATDHCGHSAECTFNVTVMPPDG